MCFCIRCAALSRNRTLVTLELGTNGLSDVSTEFLGNSLKSNFKLEGLSLWQNDISGQGAQFLADGLMVRLSACDIYG